ncbi:MAG: TIR domain-containing protein, partial [Candidatus Tectomicrobia bacterium]|nr:TIR domain-containing protein [Candidatus Tectomicrobia bacterium]
MPPEAAVFYLLGEFCGLVVYITPDTKASDWVNWEIEYAFKQGKTIVGVWELGSKGCDIPEALEEFPNAIVGWRGEDIVDAIEGRLVGPFDPNGTPVNVPVPISRHPCG